MGPSSREAEQVVTGILEADLWFMARWHVEEENKSSERRAARKRDAQSRARGGGSRETAGEEMKETADRVARPETD